MSQAASQVPLPESDDDSIIYLPLPFVVNASTDDDNKENIPPGETAREEEPEFLAIQEWLQDVDAAHGVDSDGTGSPASPVSSDRAESPTSLPELDPDWLHEVFKDQEEADEESASEDEEFTFPLHLLEKLDLGGTLPTNRRHRRPATPFQRGLEAAVKNFSTEEEVEAWLYQDPTASASSRKSEDNDEIPTVPDDDDENRIQDWLYHDDAGRKKTRGDRKRVRFTPYPPRQDKQ